MKSVNELLDDLATNIAAMKASDHLARINNTEWNRLQQLVGQIRWKLKND